MAPNEILYFHLVANPASQQLAEQLISNLRSKWPSLTMPLTQFTASVDKDNWSYFPSLERGPNKSGSVHLPLSDHPYECKPSACLASLDGSATINTNQLLPKNQSQLVLKCSKCDFQTSQKGGLINHAKNHNDCQKCDKVFLGKHGKRQLISHMKTHGIQLMTKQYLCEFCNKAFNDLSNQKRHTKTCKNKFEIPKFE